MCPITENTEHVNGIKVKRFLVETVLNYSTLVHLHIKRNL